MHIIGRLVHVLSANAYAIFILCSLMVAVVKRYLGLVDVTRDWRLAVLKVLIVTTSTIIIAIPVTRAIK